MKIQKSTKIQANNITNEDLLLINNLTMAEMKADDVFTFKAILCDNRVDRDYEAFSDKALKQLAELFLGKTVIKDHNPTADNQIARIYKTVVNAENQLLAYCYMMRTAGNADLIKEIQGGIKKEGSVSCAISSRTCNICGADLMKSHCRHVPGKSYKGQTCYCILDDAVDAYEFSLVAVPAQRNAGISKNFDDEQEEEKIKHRATIARLNAYITGGYSQ